MERAVYEIPSRFDYLRDRKLVLFYIWKEYGSIKNMALEKGVSHTTIYRYIDYFVNGTPPQKRVNRDYTFSSFMSEIIKFHREIQKLSNNLSKQFNIPPQTATSIVIHSLKSLISD